MPDSSWISHDVSPQDLCLGDHIYKWGSFFHTHHGMVYKIMEPPSPTVDPDEDDLLDRIIVLHLSFGELENSNAKIHCAPLRTFLAAGRKGWEGGLKRARYAVSATEHIMKLPGTCYPFEA